MGCDPFDSTYNSCKCGEVLTACNQNWRQCFAICDKAYEAPVFHIRNEQEWDARNSSWTSDGDARSYFHQRPDREWCTRLKRLSSGPLQDATVCNATWGS